MVTGNITFFPRVDILFANQKRLASLTDGQRRVLHAAAGDTLTHLLAGLPDREDAREFCAGGGQVVTAGNADLAPIQAAAQPVYTQMERDATTKNLIARIRQLKQGLPPAPPPPASCGSTATTAQSGGQIPEGTYAAVATKQDALRLGWQDECALRSDGAHLTLQLRGGRYIQTEGCKGHPDEIGSHGTYTVSGDRLVFQETCCGASTVTWSLDGTALVLRLPTSAPNDARFIMEHRWAKVS